MVSKVEERREPIQIFSLNFKIVKLRCREEERLTPAHTVRKEQNGDWNPADSYTICWALDTELCMALSPCCDFLCAWN